MCDTSIQNRSTFRVKEMLEHIQNSGTSNYTTREHKFNSFSEDLQIAGKKKEREKERFEDTNNTMLFGTLLFEIN